MLMAAGNALLGSDFLDTRIKYFLRITFRNAAVSSTLALAIYALPDGKLRYTYYYYHVQQIPKYGYALINRIN